MCSLIVGMSTSTFTLIHMVISLAAIGSGVVVILGMLTRRQFPGWTQIYFTASILTVVTGFSFPFDRLLRSHVLGLLSLLVVTIALFARNVFGLDGRWRAVYVVTFAASLYFNCVAAVVQLFAKIPLLKATSPTQTEPSFLFAQCAVLAIFIVLTYVTVKRVSASPVRSM